MTQGLLSEDEIEWLRSLPLTIQEEGLWTAVHASPIEPEKWTYLESAFTVRDILKDIETTFCFVGHTHRPGLVSDRIGVNTIKAGYKYLINPGSVGQPRDGDPRASAGILDTDTMEYKNIRVEFDLEPCISGLTKLGFTREEAHILIRHRN